MKPSFRLIKSLFFFISALSVVSCSTALELPQATDDMDAVYLIRYSTWGHHSLGFYENGQFTEYTYGDWQLFALNQRGFWTAWKNMTFATQGALGKKSLQIESGEPLCEKFVGCEAIVQFYAPRDKVLALEDRLRAAYQGSIESEVFNDKEKVYFVKHPDSYWGLHNCNHKTVEWLEDLGAKVSGRVFYNPSLIEGMKPKQKLITLLP